MQAVTDGQGYGAAIGFDLYSVESADGAFRFLLVELEGEGLLVVPYSAFGRLLAGVREVQAVNVQAVNLADLLEGV